MCGKRATLLALVLACNALASHSADVTFAWDYPNEGVTGFAFYCGDASRAYRTRIDIGATNTYTVSLPEGVLGFCAVTAYDAAGVESVFSNEVGLFVPADTHQAVVLPPFSVRDDGGVKPGVAGVQMQFTLPFVPSLLDLYGTLQPKPDVALVGAKTGPVKGSLVISEDHQAFTFLKTGGPLAPDTYTLTIANRSDGVIDTFGRRIEGGGVPGQDYRVVFSVERSASPVLSIGEFARGPGQPVNVPASDPAAGIPVQISTGAAVREVALTIRYNPALLTVTGVSLDRSIVADLTQAAIDPLAGVVQIRVANLSGLTDASTPLLRLRAAVPVDAPYRSQHLLDIRDLVFNAGELEGRDDDGLHVVAKAGDSSGDQSYSSADTQLIQRVIVRIDSGFSAFPLTDPLVVGDVNGSGRLESNDALLVQRKVLGQYVPEIPD